MLNLNENEIIKRLIDKFTSKSKNMYGLGLSVRNLVVGKPEPTQIYREFQNGSSSSITEVSFELTGWKSFNDEGIKHFMKGIIEEDEDFTPVVEMEVFEISSKGKITVNLVMTAVYTRYDIDTDEKIKEDIKKGSLNKNDIIREIEIRLSEIYTFVEKLRD